jgi:hypothetical protein
VDLEGLVLSWLGGTYEPASSGDPTRRELQTSTGDMSEIETTGTKFGEKK